MSDIFISYKREEQPIARNLANALESEGWTVWWDPKLRAGEHFDDVIENALSEAKCVIVLWSKLSVNSRYVKDEATFALKRSKLVPVSIEKVAVPFRFEGLHTLSLIGWDGSKDFSEFRRLVEDIASIVGPPARKHQKAQPADRQQSIAERAPEKRESRLEPGTPFRDKLKDGSQGPEMVVIPDGTFRMGDILGGRKFEQPVHTVRIPKPFAIGRYEVTFEEYDRFATATDRQLPNDQGWGRGRRPVINVSWDDAMEFAKWLSSESGKPYRLPSEAEWEYAARSGGKQETFAGTSLPDKIGEYAWYGANSGRKTQPVGSKKPNGLGLYDVTGNVWEWVQDCWHENYQDAPSDGSGWDSKDSVQHVIRGGSFNVEWEGLWSSFRTKYTSAEGKFSIGFRLARAID